MEFKRLSQVEQLTEVPENATVLAEVNGTIKRIPGEGLGGTGIPTAIIKDSEYDNFISYLLNPAQPSSMASSAPAYTYECINMTFEEAYEIMANGEPLNITAMVTDEFPTSPIAFPMFAGVAEFNVPCIIILISAMSDMIELYWTADGLSTEIPSSGEK